MKDYDEAESFETYEDLVKYWQKDENFERLKNGEKKLTGFFIGKIMKASNGTADPKKINQLLNQLIN